MPFSLCRLSVVDRRSQYTSIRFWASEPFFAYMFSLINFNTLNKFFFIDVIGAEIEKAH